MWIFPDGLRWDMVADGIQVVMCGVILACLVCRRFALRRRDLAGSLSAVAPDFFQEVWRQGLRLQVEQSMQSIRAVLETEQERLRQVLETGTLTGSEAAGSEAKTFAEPAPFRLGEDRPLRPPGAGNRYGGLAELAAQGLGVRQIAAHTRLPVGEVELALARGRQGVENEGQQ
jgi:hypothetical protein